MERLGAETARIHILDRKYLRALKVLHYSLLRHDSLQHCPIVIITNDTVVASDAFINNIADRIILLGPSDLQAFSLIRGENVLQHKKPSFAPKYTFLKLLMFKPLGFSRHIVMDCDMICVGSLDEQLLVGHGDIKAVQEYGAFTFPLRGESKRDGFPSKALEYLERVSEAQVISMCEASPFNSGFIVLQGTAISSEMYEHSLQLGREEAFKNEQSLTFETLKRAEMEYLRLPIWYNARRRIFDSLGVDFYHQFLNEVRILHFTPGKPWNIPESEYQEWDHLWHSYERYSLVI